MAVIVISCILDIAIPITMVFSIVHGSNSHVMYSEARVFSIIDDCKGYVIYPRYSYSLYIGFLNGVLSVLAGPPSTQGLCIVMAI